MARRAAAGDSVPARQVVSLYEDVADRIAGSRAEGCGLVVVLDEAGKALEHAAQAPDHADIHVLQELAEAAHRSGRKPIVLVTLLHQAFEQYAGRLNTAQRKEWAKVQGRFEDVAFQEDPQEVLRLIASSIERDSRRVPKATLDLAKTAAAAVARKTSANVFKNRKALQELLNATAPLHPVTTLVLGPLFRSELAQNERSLFAFLTGGEPHSFQEFLNSATPAEGTFYTIDRLYDYVMSV
jgi:hypothetical protein